MNKKYKNAILFLTSYLILFFISCERERLGNGIVLDSYTNLPLKGVQAISFRGKVVEENQTIIMTTDASGEFNGTTFLRGANPQLFITLSKDSFMSQTIKNPVNDTVKLVRN